MNDKNPLMTLYNRLHGAYGPQHWWPAETPFEVVVGAVLTQNTRWKNVEKAIINLKRADQLGLEKIVALSRKELAKLVRPSGFFNVKAQRLKNLCDWLQAQGGLDGVSEWDTDTLRRALLNVNGIGPETADDIMVTSKNTIHGIFRDGNEK